MNSTMRVVEIRQPLTVAVTRRGDWWRVNVIGLDNMRRDSVDALGAIEALRETMFTEFGVMPGLSNDFPADDSEALPEHFTTQLDMAWRVAVWQGDDLIEASAVGLPDCEWFCSADVADDAKTLQAVLDGVSRLLALRFGTMPVVGELRDFQTRDRLAAAAQSGGDGERLLSAMRPLLRRHHEEQAQAAVITGEAE